MTVIRIEVAECYDYGNPEDAWMTTVYLDDQVAECYGRETFAGAYAAAGDFVGRWPDVVTDPDLWVDPDEPAPEITLTIASKGAGWVATFKSGEQLISSEDHQHLAQAFFAAGRWIAAQPENHVKRPECVQADMLNQY